VIHIDGPKAKGAKWQIRPKSLFGTVGFVSMRRI